MGEEGANLILFAAGYTAPLTVGIGVLGLVFLRGLMADAHWTTVCLVAAGVLTASGLAASAIGAGLLPAFETTLPTNVNGPAPVKLLAWALQGYFNTYSWSLMVSAAAIGTGAALHIDVYGRANSTGTVTETSTT